ncbi:hypothetical protein [Acetobacter sp.]|uniref:hypothetical protein n=1 Tax=Acetobacter sp. TaxID=440 RepID=UPI0039E9AC91
MFVFQDLFNEDYIRGIDSGEEIIIEEKEVLGKGKCSFFSDSPVLFMKAKDQAPVVWALKNRKCAEAAFFTTVSKKIHNLHIIEMKSKVSLKEFLKVIDQWKGMYLSAMGILGILKEGNPKNVFVYLAYKNENIYSPHSSSPVLLKTMVGGERLPGMQEWDSGIVSLHHNVRATIIKKVREDDDCDFGKVI